MLLNYIFIDKKKKNKFILKLIKSLECEVFLMAFYVGINNIAKKVKNMYVGIDAEFPNYEYTYITEDNFDTYFNTVENDGWTWDGDVLKSGLNSTAESIMLSIKPKINVSIGYVAYLYKGSDTSTDYYFGISYTQPVTTTAKILTATGSMDTISQGSYVTRNANTGMQFYFNKSTNSTWYCTLKIQVKYESGTIIQGVARKIKKFYVGVNGIARKIFGGDISYYGTGTSLGTSRYLLAAQTVGNYAVFSCGSTAVNSAYKYAVNNIDYYDKSLVKGSTTFAYKRSRQASGTIGNYALFVGGNSESSSGQDTVQAINSSLSKSYPTILSSSYDRGSGANNGSYLIFVGTLAAQSGADPLDVYNSSLTHSTISLSGTSVKGQRDRVCASVGDYILVGGGYNIKNVVSINTSLTLSAMSSSFSYSRCNSMSASTSNHAIITGGTNSTQADVYNTSLTHSTTTGLDNTSYYAASTSIDGNAMFGGGTGSDTWSNTGAGRSTVYIYDDSIVMTKPTALEGARKGIAATALGDYVIFAGGANNSTVYGTSYIYEI